MQGEIVGLKVIYDFITQWEESDILAHIDGSPMAVKRGGRSSIKRWGNGHCYDNFVVSEEIPQWLKNIAERIIEKCLLQQMPDECSLNMYAIGDYIPPHIDNKESGNIITTLSLLGKWVVYQFQFIPKS